jgi:H+/Cl- antiporter ClcA
MKDNSDKFEDIDRYEIEALKEIKEKVFERNLETERRSFITRGIFSGLICGIFGVIFIQLIIPLADAFLTGDLSASLPSLIACTISIVVIILTLIYLRRFMAKMKQKSEISKESVDVIEYAIKRRQYVLEKRKIE